MPGRRGRALAARLARVGPRASPSWVREGYGDEGRNVLGSRRILDRGPNLLGQSGLAARR
jgi:hypothetical protein